MSRADGKCWNVQELRLEFDDATPAVFSATQAAGLCHLRNLCICAQVGRNVSVALQVLLRPELRWRNTQQ